MAVQGAVSHCLFLAVLFSQADNEWMYDAAGWVLLGAIVTGWVYFSSKAAAAAAK